MINFTAHTDDKTWVVDVTESVTIKEGSYSIVDVIHVAAFKRLVEKILETNEPAAFIGEGKYDVKLLAVVTENDEVHSSESD
jgi:hypothetical protein